MLNRCLLSSKLNKFQFYDSGSRQFLSKSSDVDPVVIPSIDDVGVENVVKRVESIDDADVGVVQPAGARRRSQSGSSDGECKSSGLHGLLFVARLCLIKPKSVEKWFLVVPCRLYQL